MEFSGSNEDGRGVGPYIGEVTPVARGGATGPLPRPWAGPSGGRPWARRQAPVAPPTGDRSFFFSRDFVANLKKKNYTLGLSPYGRATGVYF